MASDSTFTLGWRIAIVVAIIGVVANGAIREQRVVRDGKRFRQYEERLSDLEGAVRQLTAQCDALKQQATDEAGR